MRVNCRRGSRGTQILIFKKIGGVSPIGLTPPIFLKINIENGILHLTFKKNYFYLFKPFKPFKLFLVKIPNHIY